MIKVICWIMVKIRKYEVLPGFNYYASKYFSSPYGELLNEILYNNDMVLAKLHYIRIKYNKHKCFFQPRVKDLYYQNNCEKAFNLTSKYIFSVVQSKLCYHM